MLLGHELWGMCSGAWYSIEKRKRKRGTVHCWLSPAHRRDGVSCAQLECDEVGLAQVCAWPTCLLLGAWQWGCLCTSGFVKENSHAHEVGLWLEVDELVQDSRRSRKEPGRVLWCRKRKKSRKEVLGICMKGWAGTRELERTCGLGSKAVFSSAPLVKTKVISTLCSYTLMPTHLFCHQPHCQKKIVDRKTVVPNFPGALCKSAGNHFSRHHHQPEVWGLPDTVLKGKKPCTTLVKLNLKGWIECIKYRKEEVTSCPGDTLESQGGLPPCR